MPRCRAHVGRAIEYPTPRREFEAAPKGKRVVAGRTWQRPKAASDPLKITNTSRTTARDSFQASSEAVVAHVNTLPCSAWMVEPRKRMIYPGQSRSPRSPFPVPRSPAPPLCPRSPSPSPFSNQEGPPMKALRLGLPLGTAALLLLGSITTLACQQTTERPPDAVMLKRIAEAVDGDRAEAWCMWSQGYDPANPIVGVFHDPKSATGAASKAGNGAVVFGPYQAALDSTIAQTMTCVHHQDVGDERPLRPAGQDDPIQRYRQPDADDHSHRRRARQRPPAPGRGCHFPRRPGCGQVRHTLLREAGGAHGDNRHAERIRQALRREVRPQILEPRRAYNLIP